ncbi:UNVERIFIED_CONTAM: basic secretory peptidase family protein [Acetivibrio alkalicellulosi]
MKKLICLTLVISFLFMFSGVVYGETDTYTIGEYTLNWSNNDPTFDANVKQKMIDTFFIVYPQLVSRFNSNAPRIVNFVIDKDMNEYPAYALGDTVVYSSNWFKNNPNDIDVVTHEIMHVVQSYSSQTPWWLTEGIADYARHVYGLNNSVQGWYLPGYSPSQSYTDGYRVTARFLLWLEIHINPNIVDQIDWRLTNFRYSSTLWTFLTGRTLDQLWTEYSQNPDITEPINGNNIALNKPVIASGHIVGENPEKAVDGVVSGNSKWCSTNYGDKWLRVDLQQNYTISRWIVKHAGEGGETPLYNTRNFKLQKSFDGYTWVDVDTVTGNVSNVTDRTVTPFTARYIRLYITQSEQNSNHAARIFELEIYE